MDKNSFRNPLKQNYGHVLALMDLLSLPKDAFVPVVAFSGAATLKVRAVQPVVYIGGLKRVILSYRKVKFREDEIQTIASRIQAERMEGGFVDRKNHVRNIKANLSEQKSKIENGVCPKCGKKLQLRQGRYGQFYGCSGYPDCRFTQNLR